MDSYINAAEIRKAQLKPGVVLNHGGQNRMNEVTFAAFKETCPGATENFVACKHLSDTEIQVDRVNKGTPGCVKLRPAGNEKTALFSAGPILAAVPALKVEKGYLRLLSFRIDKDPEGKSHFVIILEPNTVIPAPKRSSTKTTPGAKTKSETAKHPATQA